MHSWNDQRLLRMKKLETQLREVIQSNHGREKQHLSHMCQSQPPTVVCLRCNRPGHIARDCYTYPPQKKQSSNATEPLV